MRRFGWTLAIAGLAACSGPTTDSIDTFPETFLPDEGNPCKDLVFVHDGEAAPKVNDIWNVHLECDGAYMMGPYVIRVTPSELSSIDELRITWKKAGSGTLRMQAGTEVKTIDVTVAQ